MCVVDADTKSHGAVQTRRFRREGRLRCEGRLSSLSLLIMSEADSSQEAKQRASRPSAAPRQSVAAQLSRTLEERRAWVSSSAARSQPSPPGSRSRPPEEPRVPLRLVVSKCLEDWGIDSDSSEEEDDFCGWRVGSRALPIPDDGRRDERRASNSSSIDGGIGGRAPSQKGCTVQ